MKFRTDFVTNSSSSSFVVAQEGEFTEKQKKELLDQIISTFLGECSLSPESSEEEIKSFFEEFGLDEEYDSKKVSEIRKALSEGKTVYGGRIIFDEAEYGLESLYEQVWDVLKESGEGRFKEIDTELGY